jgi:hypothetical protein
MPVIPTSHTYRPACIVADRRNGVNSAKWVYFGIVFGGFKQSGIGREGDREGLLRYLESITQAVPPAIATAPLCTPAPLNATGCDRRMVAAGTSQMAVGSCATAVPSLTRTGRLIPSGRYAPPSQISPKRCSGDVARRSGCPSKPARGAGLRRQRVPLAEAVDQFTGSGHFTIGVAPLTDHLIEHGVITHAETPAQAAGT